MDSTSLLNRYRPDETQNALAKYEASGASSILNLVIIAAMAAWRLAVNGVSRRPSILSATRKG
jgi:hypothetical protein